MLSQPQTFEKETFIGYTVDMNIQDSMPCVLYTNSSKQQGLGF